MSEDTEQATDCDQREDVASQSGGAAGQRDDLGTGNRHGLNMRVANWSIGLVLLSIPSLVLVPGGGYKAFASPVLAALGAVLGGCALVLCFWRSGQYAGRARATGAIFVGLIMLLSYRPLVSRFLYRQVASVCGANLRCIWAALSSYNDKYSTLPLNLQALQQEGLVVPWHLQCPLEAIRQYEEEPDYVYVTELRFDDYADWIVAYDYPTNHSGQGGYILYLDGKVVYYSMEDFLHEIGSFRAAYIAARGEPPSTIGPDWP